MITIETTYPGDLRTTARHLRSGVEIITDAPVDNLGKGEAFSPTDLLAASLGSCMLTLMGIAARKKRISIDSTKVEITKIMGTDPRKVIEVKLKFFMPTNNYSEADKLALEKAACTCPVALSLHPDLKQSVEFYYS